jgi:uncharacterized protein
LDSLHRLHIQLILVLILSTIVLEMRTGKRSLGDLLFGQTRGRVLALLYGRPDEAYHLREIARRTETSVGSIQRELSALADAGLISKSALGNQVFYRANAANPLFSDLRSLVAKTTGIFKLLEHALAPLSASIDFAFVYGSVATGQDTASSDIDLMIVGLTTLDQVLDALSPVEKLLLRPVNPTIYTPEDFEQKLRAGNHFLRSLQNSKKVFLIGGEDGLTGARANRLVQNGDHQSARD